MKSPLLLLFIPLSFLLSCSQELIPDEVFTIASSTPVSIHLSPAEDDLIKWAAQDLAEDLGKMLDKEIPITFTDTLVPGSPGIYIGRVGSKLMEKELLDQTQALKDQWEHFYLGKQQTNLFIVGSDLRGTVYGIFDLAEQVGISPWKWWADVSPEKQTQIEIQLPKDGIKEGPSVQYRGIFLNDEDWGLQPWAANTFEPEVNDIGPKTYEKIFQLLLRLKANTIWPAMHPCTQAFFDIAGNQEMAARYHIFVGTSHAEPLLRNNVGEWDKTTQGPYNYFTNAEQVQAYWQERIEQAKDGEYIFTLGMRGIHDSGMEGNASRSEKKQLLERIITDQRSMLSKTLTRHIEAIPQTFIPYKEVLELYENGLQVPEDITLMWTDDNYGYIRRLSNEEEQRRSGGSGIYYHLSYWGRPHDYLWLSTTQPGLIWYEMSRAYQNGAKKIWIANVGDIKPGEYNMEFFLDLAWDINGISEKTIKQHLVAWSAREFGEESAQKIANLKNEYYRLAFLRKPEYMGWSQTEPTTGIHPTEFTTNNENEIQRRIDAYTQLHKSAAELSSQIPVEKQAAYFQLIQYPIQAAALMNHKFLYAQQALYEKDNGKKRQLTDQARAAYEAIQALTTSYNKQISNGKWNQMMSMQPRRLPVFEMPNYPPVLEDLQVEEETNVKPIFLQVDAFTNSYSTENHDWRKVEGLGYSNESITLFPLQHHSFPADSPYLSYSFDVEQAGKYAVEIRCLPTHANDFNHQVWIELEGRVSDTFALNTQGRSEAWKTNVLRNYVAATFPITFEQAGLHKIKVFVNQTGIVLDQIAIIPENHPPFYENVR